MSKNPFINIYDLDRPGIDFNFYVGARGYGKTYSALGGVLGLENKMTGEKFDKNFTKNKEFIYLRRTKTEAETCLDSYKGPAANPFSAINNDYGLHMSITKINDNINGIYMQEEIDGKMKNSGAPIGYGFALSTFSNVRGISVPNVNTIVYDEFIPQKDARTMKEEASALFNAYETVARNREYFGEEPVKLRCLSNSNDINSPIFVTLGVIRDVEKIANKIKNGTSKIESLYYPERRLGIHIMASSDEFVEMKNQQALYQLTRGTEFYNMALGNDFAYNDFSLVGYKNISGYLPLCQLDRFYLYMRKDKSELYFTYAKARVQNKYNSKNEQDIIAFNRKYLFLNDYFVNSKITFESIEIKEKVLECLGY